MPLPSPDISPFFILLYFIYFLIKMKMSWKDTSMLHWMKEELYASSIFGVLKLDTLRMASALSRLCFSLHAASFSLCDGGICSWGYIYPQDIEKSGMTTPDAWAHNTPDPKSRMHSFQLKVQGSPSNCPFLHYFTYPWASILKLVCVLWVFQVRSHACLWGQAPDSVPRRRGVLGSTINETNMLVRITWLTALVLYLL